MTFKFISNDKYETTGDIKERFGRNLHRIKSKRDLGIFPAGTIGGWIETEDNLSVHGNAWISGDAEVFGNARILDDAQVRDNSLIYGDAKVSDTAIVYAGAQIYGQARIGGKSLAFGSARVFDNATIGGSAQLSGMCRIYEESQIYGEATISGSAQIFGRSHIFGCAAIYGSADISGDARIDHWQKYFSAHPLGKKGRCLTAFIVKDGGIWINHDNFSGSIGTYAETIARKLAGENHKEASRLVIELIKKQLDRAAPTSEAEA